MARIGILTCSNCTQETNCAAVVCLGDMRKRRGFFDRYQNDEKLDLIGIINCAGCPTIAAPEKILKKVKALAEYRLAALHFSYCMTALCPFLKKYQFVINKVYPELEVVLGTHVAINKIQFQSDVKELLCTSDSNVQDMNNIITGTFEKSTESKHPFIYY